MSGRLDPAPLVLRPADYADPEAAELEAAVQREYVRRYGGVDTTAMDPGQFRAPRGRFFLGCWRGTPAAMGGWRPQESGLRGLRDGDAEIKRVYVVPEARGHGFARAVLAELERTARTAGRLRMVLETGTGQPEAIALYVSSGYVACEKFGVYAEEDSARNFAKDLVAGTPEPVPARER